MSNDNVIQDRVQKEQNLASHADFQSEYTRTKLAEKLASNAISSNVWLLFWFSRNHLTLCSTIITVSIYFTSRGFLAVEHSQKGKQIRVMCALKLFIIFMFEFLFLRFLLLMESAQNPKERKRVRMQHDLSFVLMRTLLFWTFGRCFLCSFHFDWMVCVINFSFWHHWFT